MTLSEIKERIQNPKNGQSIENGRKYESRLRLFTEPKSENEIKKETAWSEFTKRLSNRLGDKKYKRILDFVDLPLPVIDISESIHKDLCKVFDSRNPYFAVNYDNIAIQKRIKPIIDELEIKHFIENWGEKVILNMPNLVVVIDKDDKGNPYLVTVTNDRIVDYELSECKTKFELIVFIHSVTETDINYSVYDSEFYRVFRKNKSSNEVFLETENAHTAGKCPARFFMSDIRNQKDDFSRKIPFTNVTSKLSQWQTFDIYQDYADSYAPFPMIQKPAEVCENVECVGGYIETEVTHFENGTEVLSTAKTECQKCKSRQLTGPGTVVSIHPRQEKEDPTDADVLKIVTIDPSSLKYTQDKLNQMEQYIRLKTIGKAPLIEKQALNESQVIGSFEDQKQVLIHLKTNFERLYKWIVKTSIKLIDPNIEVSVEANYGTEFYLYSVEDLMNMYKLAVDSGLPEIEKESIFKQIIETKYKGNSERIDKAMTTLYLDPLPFDSVERAIELKNLGIISDADLRLKVNLPRFVNKFELMNGSVSEFGKALKPYDRFKKIKEILNSYINESE